MSYAGDAVGDCGARCRWAAKRCSFNWRFLVSNAANCARIRQVRVGFADERRTYTQVFERYALELSRHMTILDVARHLDVGWDLIKDIQKTRSAASASLRPKLKDLRQIAIDEIAIGKGHRYLTLVLDLDTGAVVFVGDGKGAEALKPFWRRLKRRRAQGSKPWPWTCRQPTSRPSQKTLPKATIVFDHFHVVKLFNDKLSGLSSRALATKPRGELEKKVLKGTRWLLLKNPENLDEERNEPQRLEEALELNQPLATAYYMKEDLRQFWAQRTRKACQPDS